MSRLSKYIYKKMAGEPIVDEKNPLASFFAELIRLYLMSPIIVFNIIKTSFIIAMVLIIITAIVII